MGIDRTSPTSSRANTRNLLRVTCAVLIAVGGAVAVIALVKTRARPPAPTKQAVAGAGNQMAADLSPSFGSSSDTPRAETVTPLSPEDCDAIVRQCPNVRSAAPLLRVRTSVAAGKHTWAPNWIYGTTPALLDVRDWTKLTAGSCFTDADVLTAANVCVIGQTVARELFEEQSPLGKEVRIGNTAMVVVGVLAPKGVNMYGMDNDDIVLVPWTTIKFRVRVKAVDPRIPPGPLTSPPGSAWLSAVDQILISTASSGNNAAATREVTALLRRRHHIAAQQPDDFEIRDVALATGPAEHTPPAVAHPVMRIDSATATGSGVTFGAAAATAPAVTATGTLEPRDAVEVGAQVVGRIVGLGIDADGKPIDFRSRVQRDMVLAKIDPTSYMAELESAEAVLKSAVAAVESAEARRALYRAQQADAADAWARAQKLRPNEDVPGEAISDNDYRAAKSAFAVANANARLGDALIKEAQLNVDKSKAEKAKAEKNLAYCTIRSPVDGVVIDRRVNVGQSVAGVIDPSSLFLIAKDLNQLQIWVSMNEADIKKVSEGQPVKFTLDAFPREVFAGQVEKVRLDALMARNEVTYVVEVNISNANGRFFPYMTAMVEFENPPPDKAARGSP